VSYFVTTDTLVTWLILPDGEVEVFRSRGFEVPGQAGAGSAAAAAQRLGTLLFPAEILDRLPAGTELVIVPHGPLNLLPFAALTLPGSAEPLGVRHALRYSPSLSTLAEIAERGEGIGAAEAVARALVVGDPAMPEVTGTSGERIRLGQLSGAAAEGQWVARQVKGRALTGTEATESQVRSLFPTATLVHLATHGYAYASEAMARQSFIALAPDAQHDGLLTVGEVLDEIPSLVAELVVLSACQTGLGDLKQAEGTVGLRRSMFGVHLDSKIRSTGRPSNLWAR
jgi:CHAT domain-containing protein